MTTTPTSVHELKQALITHHRGHQNKDFISVPVDADNWPRVAALLGISVQTMPQFLGQLCCGGATIKAEGNAQMVFLSDAAINAIVPGLLL